MTNPIRQTAIRGLCVGDTVTYSRRFTQRQTQEFGNLTRDYNPVHYDTRWTQAKGFKGLICHGLLVGSMICEFGGQVGWLATGMDFKFIRPVYFGDTITCEIKIKTIEASGRAEAEARFTNADDEQVCYAFLTGRIPIGPEKAILEKMVAQGDPTNNLSESRGYSMSRDSETGTVEDN